MKGHDPEKIRSLIDTHLSLQWCRENLVCPISEYKQDFSTGEEKPGIIIAIGNLSYLGTIGDFIKMRLDSSGLSCYFTERSPEEITDLLNKAAQERIILGTDASQFTDDNILEALQEADRDREEVENDNIVEALKEGDGESQDGFNIDFDDSDEIFLTEDELDLSQELLGSKIQQAAAQILINSTRSNVSDIHIEPLEEFYQIRVRRDGVMQNYVRMPRSAGIKLTACMKNMATMSIAERRVSQDGKINRRFEGHRMEFRCSTVPTKHGERMVLRILNSNESMLSLDMLITDHSVKDKLREMISEQNGIIIFSGSTGSGKSTTLASALREKDNGELSILTAEDPIEYDLGGNIQQAPVIRANGQTFASLLQSILRSDPDIILIGEIRDPETAESSMDAAETGHLVFTTLHANSASNSVTRLLDMGVPSYKLTASLRGVLAQRLIRRVCPSCSAERPITEAESRFTGLEIGTPVRHASALTAKEKQAGKEGGTLCTQCDGTGYRGRIGIYELLHMSRKVSEAIKKQMSTQEIEDIAVGEGMLSFKSYGAKLVADQLTTVEELQKLC